MKRQIAETGSISVSDYMAAANDHYYATCEPFGVAGDFTTSPEISQMFGELVGIWLADLWQRAGGPPGTRYVELGPGRGTLAADAARAMRAVGLEPPFELVERSPRLKRAQAERVPDAILHDDVSTVSAIGPLLIVANEFFDALPIRQFAADEMRELRVSWREDHFVRDEAKKVVEDSPASIDIVRAIARRLATQGGAALIVDYGHAQPSTGDTLQAISSHTFADPWEAPGSRDLTAHVDFSVLAATARGEGARIFGPVGQGDWLEAMGIAVRAASLARAAPSRSEEFAAARDRLTAPGQMGRLFKVMALVAPGWPDPSGFGQQTS